MSVDYSNAEQERERIIIERQRRLARSFERMRADIDEQIATMNMSSVSERVKRQQLEEIRYELQRQLSSLYSGLEDNLKSDMVSIGNSVLSDSAAFYKSLGMPISMAITSFPVDVMENVINGSVYKEKWFLSGALWGDYQSKLDDINEIITNGIGQNLPTYDIAKALEKYVDPSAKKDWAWSKVYPGTAKTVDYNAQRLARTLISHAYQQNVVRQAQANPFASGVKWLSAMTARTCEICKDRDGKIFPVDDVPMDHPNGLCTFSVETPSMMEMSDTLAKWANGEPTEYDDQLNAYYEGRPIEHKITLEDTQGRRIVVDGKDISDIWKRRSDEFDFEIEDVMNAQGFDGLPRVVSAEEFDRLVKESSFVAQRTYSAGDQQTLDQYREMLYNGKWYVDCSTGGAQYGQGMYCAADYNGKLTDGIKEEMRHYIETNDQRGNGLAYIETLTLDKSAKIADYDSLLYEFNRYHSITQKAIYEQKIEELKTFGYSDDFIRAIRSDAGFGRSGDALAYARLSKTEQDVFLSVADKVFDNYEAEAKIKLINNIGSYAASLGYDAINAKGHGRSGSYTVILNRTKLIIKEP